MTSTIGIDIGGTAIKGALVEVDTGVLTSERRSMSTPQPALPQAVAEAVATMCAGFPDAASSVGITVPAVVTHGVVRTAANIDPTWIGTDAVALFEGALGRSVVLLNDADAVGIAECAIGAARGVDGVVMVVTLGTGIGSALIVDGRLAPNTELGHLSHDDVDMCYWACAASMVRDNLSWAQWAQRLQVFLARAEELVWPDLFVIGGAVSAEADRYVPLLRLHTPVVPAQLLNDSGVIGAALATRG